MTGRRTFFSFHYQRDVWRAANVRNAGQVDARAAAGWIDASLWEATKRKGDAAVRRLIEDGLKGTSVTVVLIGAQTSSRRWVKYEIERSIRRGNGLLGVRIHKIRDEQRKTSQRGEAPQSLVTYGAKVYDYDRQLLGGWVELAAIRAGHPCLKHAETSCLACRLKIWLF